MDANHDGSISRAEAKGNADLIREFQVVDTNHNGRLSKDEMKGWLDWAIDAWPAKGSAAGRPSPQGTRRSTRVERRRIKGPPPCAKAIASRVAGGSPRRAPCRAATSPQTGRC